MNDKTAKTSNADEVEGNSFRGHAPVEDVEGNIRLRSAEQDDEVEGNSFRGHAPVEDVEGNIRLRSAGDDDAEGNSAKAHGG